MTRISRSAGRGTCCLAPGKINDLIGDWLSGERAAIELPSANDVTRMALALAMATTLPLLEVPPSGWSIE
ncbi:hypothetical protein AA13594_0690 [Gluconacetobacter azotocaptans DSM 13594]|nr:hypothetical protein AA13594_0690 [Gluconacetobacter azotocaptans DSM 13594]